MSLRAAVRELSERGILSCIGKRGARCRSRDFFSVPRNARHYVRFGDCSPYRTILP